MSGLTEEQYKAEYDKAIEAIDSATKGEPVKEEPEVITEAPKDAQVEEEKTPDPLDVIRQELEQTKKALKDTQAWGTKSQQRLAEIERQRQADERERTKPAILQANPELADAIKYVASDPEPVQQRQRQHEDWMETIDKAHPGIFSTDIDPELEQALKERLEKLGDAISDPLIAIREIAAEKVAFTERQIGKRFIVEQEKQQKKQAMSVPKLGGGAERVTLDKDASEVNRIKNMSDAEFAREVKKAKGY